VSYFYSWTLFGKTTVTKRRGCSPPKPTSPTQTNVQHISKTRRHRYTICIFNRSLPKVFCNPRKCTCLPRAETSRWMFKTTYQVMPTTWRITLTSVRVIHSCFVYFVFFFFDHGKSSQRKVRVYCIPQSPRDDRSLLLSSTSEDDTMVVDSILTTCEFPDETSQHADDAESKLSACHSPHLRVSRMHCIYVMSERFGMLV
jgi:hypothetical protein